MFVRHLVISGLEELADLKVQEKLWTGKIEGQIGSVEEAFCRVFDDSSLGRVLDSKKERDRLPAALRDKAVELDRAGRKIPDGADPWDVIKNPAMNDVRALAAELLALVKAMPEEAS